MALVFGTDDGIKWLEQEEIMIIWAKEKILYDCCIKRDIHLTIQLDWAKWYNYKSQTEDIVQ